jgi:hypothetical protein
MIEFKLRRLGMVMEPEPGQSPRSRRRLESCRRSRFRRIAVPVSAAGRERELLAHWRRTSVIQ